VAGWAAFLRDLPRAVADDLDGTAAPHQLVVRSMVKLWFGNKDLHFECGLYERRKVVELGLHFESDAITNLQLLGAFRAHRKTIAKRIPTARIEAWDKGWARVWEPIEIGPLDVALRTIVARRLATYVRVLEPILEEELPADARWSR
jgi:hypothetical protein